MLCVWVHGCDPWRVSDGSRLALYQTLSIKCPSSIFFRQHVLCVTVPFFLSFFVLFLFLFCFCFCFVVVFVLFLFFMLSLELCRCSSDLFLSSRLRTGLATTYITGYVWSSHTAEYGSTGYGCQSCLWSAEQGK